jgi:hypothetical protein
MSHITGSHRGLAALRPLRDIDNLVMVDAETNKALRQAAAKVNATARKRLGTDTAKSLSMLTYQLIGEQLVRKLWADGRAASRRVADRQAVTIEFDANWAELDLVPVFDAELASTVDAGVDLWADGWMIQCKTGQGPRSRHVETAAERRLAELKSLGDLRLSAPHQAEWFLVCDESESSLDRPGYAIVDEAPALADAQQDFIRLATTLIRRMFRTRVRHTFKAPALAAGVDHSSESHRSRAPGATRKTSFLAFRELAPI